MGSMEGLEGPPEWALSDRMVVSPFQTEGLRIGLIGPLIEPIEGSIPSRSPIGGGVARSRTP